MSSATILLVDDTPANVRLFDALLGTYDYEVRAASSGAEALAVIETDPPDLVLLDVRMPGLDGFEVCRRLRRTEHGAALPVIMVTAGGSEEKVAALEAGADDFVTRPFDHSELLARVRSLLRTKRYQDTIVEQAAELAAWNRVLEEQVAEQVEEVQRLQRLRRFLSPAIADAVIRSQDDSLLEPHRAEVALVCADVRGFSTFAARAEPEDVVAALRDYHSVLGEVVSRHGATVGQCTAEALSMFFNDPLPCSEPALRAARAALDLRDALGGLAERWRQFGWDAGVGISVAYGFATLGVLGFDGRREYTAIGPLINTATDLARDAGNGEVLLGPRAQVEVGSVVDAVAQQPGGTVSSGTTVWALQAAPPEAPARPAVVANQPTRERIEVRVLGPIELALDGRTVPLPGLKLRRLLGLLATHPGQVVSVDRLADALWEAEPPSGTTATLRVYVSRLRKILAAAGQDGALVTHPSAYQLLLGADAVDAVRYDALAREGHQALRDGRTADACHALGQALAMWRGPAYAELAGSYHVSAEVLRLEESRQETAEDYIEAQLRAGNHRQVLADLQSLMATYPLRERVCGQLMTALYRAGRPAEALDTFQAFRVRLADELGLDPSAELATLHAAMLNRAAELEVPERA
jgi:DNA-binding response OmpR family regulator